MKPALLAWSVLIVCVVSANAAVAHEINPKLLEQITGEAVSDAQGSVAADPDPRVMSRRFYTLPEWYIVYTAIEYGAFVETGGRPSQFPYLRSTKQLWEVWSEAERAAQEPPDPTTATVLWTIAISTSIEQVVIGVYEATIGRVFEWLHFGYKTAEDRYIDAVAIEYGAFLTHTPWYAFPYGEKLRGLWSTWGWSSISPRGLERRLVYTVGYGLKAVYASGIKALSQSQFEGGAGLITEVLITGDVDRVKSLASWPVEEHAGGELHLSLPRYRAFLPALLTLRATDATVVSIQGHDRISLSVVESASERCTPLLAYQAFAMPVLSRDGFLRAIYDVPVSEIFSTAAAVENCGYAIEHLYDF